MKTEEDDDTFMSNGVHNELSSEERKLIAELIKNENENSKKLKTTDIKKYLYKQNPKAVFSFLRKGVAYYVTTIRNENKLIPEDKNITFEIPVTDMGDADFFYVMDGKLLIRWIVNYDEIENN